MKNLVRLLTILTMFTAGALAVSRPTSAMDDDWSEESSSLKSSSSIQSEINKDTILKKEEYIPSSHLENKQKPEQHGDTKFATDKDTILKKEKNAPSSYLGHKRKFVRYNLKTKKTKQKRLNPFLETSPTHNTTLSQRINSITFSNLNLEIAKISGDSESKLHKLRELIKEEIKKIQKESYYLNLEHSTDNIEKAKHLLEKINPIIEQYQPVGDNKNTNITTRNQEKIDEIVKDIKKMQHDITEWLDHKNK